MENLAQKRHFWDFGQTFTANIFHYIEVNLKKSYRFGISIKFLVKKKNTKKKNTKKYHFVKLLKNMLVHKIKI